MVWLIDLITLWAIALDLYLVLKIFASTLKIEHFDFVSSYSSLYWVMEINKQVAVWSVILE